MAARVGRKPFRLKHLKRLAASPLARRRLEWLLKSLSGECTVPEACVALGINESRFHKLRGDWLQAAAESLEPGRPGRRPKRVSPEAEQVATLREQVRRLELQWETSQVRAELAQSLPQVARGAAGTPKKTTGPKTASRRSPRSRRARGKRRP